MATSRLDTTAAVSGKNFRVLASDIEDTLILNPLTQRTTPGRTTIEVVNEGAFPIRLFFEGSVFSDGRSIASGSSICYAITDKVKLYARGIGGTVDLQITELV